MDSISQTTEIVTQTASSASGIEAIPPASMNQLVDMTDLEIESDSYRLFIVPSVLDACGSAEGCRIPLYQKSTASLLPTWALAIADEPNEASCEIRGQLHLKLNFGPSTDTIFVKNCARKVVFLEALDQSNINHRARKTLCTDGRLYPGAWRFSCRAFSMQVVVFPRRYPCYREERCI
jgi:hypothetical protein